MLKLPVASHPKVAVIIPCYRVRTTIVNVIRSVGVEVDTIYCVDDACPEGSGSIVLEECSDDRRLQVLFRRCNGGVGAATMTGYKAAISDGATILVKIDGDGQMDTRLVPDLVRPILTGEADYVKGNRFFNIETVKAMPWMRLVGNAGLSFMSKLSSGYWHLFDPTNGFTAIEGRVAAVLPFDRINQRFFFESDLLFHLGLLRARVVELPMVSIYRDEQRSNLNELRALMTFPLWHFRNLIQRIFYNYFLRNFGLASVNLVMSLGLLLWGLLFGVWAWLRVIASDTPATAGTVMLAALPTLVGFQLLLSFLAYDMAFVPQQPIHSRISTLVPRQFTARDR